MSNSKIALLDLGGVVFQSKGKSNDEIDWELIWRLNEKYGARMDLGGDGFPDFLKEYNAETKQSLKSEMFLEKVFDSLDFNQELVSFLSSTREIVIVSDNYRENIEYISKRYKFSSWAIKQIYSFDYKMYKSNPNFFKRLLEDLHDYNVEDMLFIDDSPSKLTSAAQHGIQGVQFKNNEQVIQAIVKIGC